MFFELGRCDKLRGTQMQFILCSALNLHICSDLGIESLLLELIP